MRIELKGLYKPIETRPTEEFPAFAILIRRNNADKTHLLGALKEGLAEIPVIGVDEITPYDMDSFRPPEARQADRR